MDRIDVRERLEPDWNVAPSKKVYAVLTRRSRAGDDAGTGAAAATAGEHSHRGDDAAAAGPRRRLVSLRWGLVPSWAKDIAMGNRLINARAETAAEKPAFRRAFAARRCLLPAEGFYEWRGETKGKRQPFFIRPRDGMLAMAGLYEIWRDPTRADDDPEAFLWSTVILTTQAVDELGEIHDRMPMLVERDQWSQWLDPENHDAAALSSMLTPAVPGVLDVYPVSTEVNRVSNNGPHLIEPATL